MTDRVDINRLLGDMRNLKAQTQAFQRPQGVGDTPTGMRSLGALPVEWDNKSSQLWRFNDAGSQQSE